MIAPGRSNAPRRRSDSPSTRGAASATASPIGTFTKNTQRQSAYWTSRPPAIRPTAPPAMLIAAYTPMARLRGGPSGKVTAISDSAVGAANAPPTPCRTRAVSSHSWLVANPPSSEATENSKMPKMKTRRRPSRSPDLPPSRSSPPNASAYALTTHSRLVPEKPSAFLDVRQGDVDDGRVEHDHELRRRDDGEGQAQPPRRGAGRRAGGAGRRRGTDLPGRLPGVWCCGGQDNSP